jgi:hypothetical protein
MIRQKESKIPTTHFSHIGVVGSKKTNNPKRLSTHPNITIPIKNTKMYVKNGPTNSQINSRNFFIIIFFQRLVLTIAHF